MGIENTWPNAIKNCGKPCVLYVLKNYCAGAD